uniref:Uncharacterized protein n=1 Tax=Anguilla anguilla TaxID=7936 RepID=A0A0E9RWS1_ANGAN
MKQPAERQMQSHWVMFRVKWHSLSKRVTLQCLLLFF